MKELLTGAWEVLLAGDWRWVILLTMGYLFTMWISAYSARLKGCVEGMERHNEMVKPMIMHGAGVTMAAMRALRCLGGSGLVSKLDQKQLDEARVVLARGIAGDLPKDAELKITTVEKSVSTGPVVVSDGQLDPD